MMYNRMEMRLGIRFVPKDEGKYWTSSRLVRVSPERYSGQFAQIFNIKVSSFISNVLLPPLSVVNSLASDFVAPTFRYLDIYRKDESYIYINIFFIHHPLRDKTKIIDYNKIII